MALARGLIGYAPAVVVPRLVTLLQITLLTRLIAPTEFGFFVLVLTLGDAIDAVCCAWIRVVLSRYAAGTTGDALAREAARAVLLFGLAGFGAALPAAAAVASFQHVAAWPIFTSLVVYLAVNGACRLSLTILTLRGLKLAFFGVEAVRTLAGFAGVMALAGSGLATTFAPLLGAMNVAAGVAAVLGLAVAFRGLGWRRPQGWGLDRMHYVLPLLAGAVASVLLNSSDRLVTQSFAGAAALATYAAAVMLARQPLEFLFSVVNVRTFPELMATYETGGPTVAGERMGDLIAVMALLACPAALGLALVAGPLAETFLPTAYVASARVIIPIGAAAGLAIGFKSFVFDQVLHMRRKIWGNTLMVLPITLGGIVLSGIMASRVGAVGCAVALLIQALLALSVSVVQAVRLLPIVVNRADLGRIALMCAAMAVTVSAVLAMVSGMPAAVRLACAVLGGAGCYGLSGLALRPGPVRDLLPASWVRA
ncbi:oligosaccharide flippase family protein [Lichenihabitans sp. Uapishka_5]|uniref:lipopolysaccharide biosynthesis protein n=1 Tax=Lichenihabitans sp. Uapishka_5 TaxID=3037302 RepID=UPI0029E816BE|nr:oligosaccharide flippase family protein [Lichenihabitans sp. Uapishka_5]MDX7952237.1 oligosaccharide flippase family protein [Lichenihabitans sp. Uapishka_5]